MSKEKTKGSIELNPTSMDIEKSKNIYMPSPAIKFACVLGAYAVVMSAGSTNNKIVTGMKNEVIEYKDNSVGSISYPFYKVLPTKGIGSTLTKSVMQETKDYGLNIYTSDVVSQKIVRDLRKEIAMLKNRLQSSLPVHTLVYMISSSIVGAIATTLLVLRFAGNIYTIDPYYLICTCIIAVGLFLTAATSIKDWKDNLISEKE